jgi:hypothetical protein
MPFKSFSDFEYVDGTRLLPSDYLVGYREFNKEYRTKIEDLTIQLVKNLDLQVAPEVLYVNLNGKDTNSGRSDFNALRTIKRAAAKALALSRQNMTPAGKALEAATGIWGIGSKQVNIFVRTGDYFEDNPIYLPPAVTLIGDNLRSASIIPKNKCFDILWVNNRCYVWGFTFRTHKKPSYAIAYPEFRYLKGLEVVDYPFEDTDPSTKYPRLVDAINRQKALYQLGLDEEIPSYTRVTSETIDPDDIDLSNDFGDPIFDPARIAFLRRYFLNIPASPNNFQFFNEGESLDIIDFDESEWFESTDPININRPYQLTSPYTQGCSSITQSTTPWANDAGGGILVDGYKVDGPLRSMVTDSFTQFNEGGKGIHIVNNGYAQLVSTFTICCTEGVICESGGTCSINTSNCSFGLSGLVARGKSPNPTLVGKLGADIDGVVDTIVIKGLSGYSNEHEPAFVEEYQPYPGQIFYINYTPINGGAARLYPNPDPIGIPPEVPWIINSGNYFSIVSASPAVLDTEANDGTYTCSVQLEENYTPRLDTSWGENPYDSRFNGQFQVRVEGGEHKIYMFIRSAITTSSHTMEYIGTGTNLLSAIPQKGGRPIVANEAVFDNEGRVYFTLTNQLGDFRIGQGLTIVQATGTIEGETFERSILQITTPFTLSIGSGI